MPDLKKYGSRNPNTNNVPVSIEIKMLVQHLSIINLKKKKVDSAFNFTKQSQVEVGKVINSLNMKVIKTSKDIFPGFIV